MMNFVRRFGLSNNKRTSFRKSSGRRQTVFTSELLETRWLMAGDLEADQSPSSLALLYALSRGGPALLAHSGVKSPTQAVVDKPVVPANFGSSSNAPAANVAIQSSLPPRRPVPAIPPTSQIATSAEAEPGDISIQIGQDTFVIYNSNSGKVSLDSDVDLGTLELNSKSGIFTGNSALNLGGQFDVDTDTKIFKLSTDGFGSLTFGNVAKTGLTEAQLVEDLRIAGSGVPGPTGIVYSSDDVLITLQALDSSGTAISSLKVGDEFFLVANVEDERFGPTQQPATGVFAAYMDVAFDKARLTPVGSIQYGSTFPNSQKGTIGDGLIDEVGAFAGTQATGRDRKELFRVRMRATAEGTATVSTNAADLLPADEVLIYDRDESVNANRIDFGSLSLTITDTPKSNDLVAFAKALADAGVKFYGAAWHAGTTTQKELFDDGQEFLPFIEVTNYQADTNRGLNQVAQANNITNVSQLPTWVFQDGTRRTGILQLSEIASLSGIAIPQSNRPALIGLGDVTLLGGSPLHVPLNAYDPTINEELTFEVTSSNPQLVQPTLVKGNNRNMVIDVDGFGKLNFLLFEDRANRATEHISELAEEGFYEDVIFHRIINNFVIQGGDPTGTGSGGSDKGDFDDQFHVDLQHNRTGILSMAKSTDDTNDSQFFITEGPQRHLDSNHTIFGQLIEGEKNRANLSDTYAPGTRPSPEVAINSVSLVNDTENSLVMLKAAAGATGTADVTVKVTDETGHSFEQTFKVTVSADTVNNEPFLKDIDEASLRTPAGAPFELTLEGVDVEGDPIYYYGEIVGNQNVTMTVDKNTGQVMLTPPSGFVGVLEADVRVSSNVNPDEVLDGAFDEQRIQITVTPGKPAVDLVAASDSGASDSDNVTNATALQFSVSNVSDGAIVELYRQESSTSRTKIGEATATGNSVTISTSNLTSDGSFQIVATQKLTMNGDTVSSDFSDVLNVTVDRQAPGAFPTTPAPPTTAMAGTPLTFDAAHPDEGDPGLSYSLVGAPTGATIDPSTGQLAWTPADNQVGAQTFSIRMSDAAGNFADQNLAIEVAPNRLVAVTLVAADLNGNPIEAVVTGNEFLLQVYVDDLRTSGTLGVRAAYIDTNYDQTKLSIVQPIEFGSSYPDDRTGITSTPGIIDEAGAATASNLGGDRMLLWSVRMKADMAGDISITGDLAEDDDFLLADSTQPVPEGNVTFAPATFKIVSTVYAQSDAATVDEDSGATPIDVLDNDLLGLTATSLTVTSAQGATNGVVTVASDGSQVTYQPNANFHGEDTFTYTIKSNNNNETHTGTVRVTVSPVNDDPVANDDTIEVDEDVTNFVLNVLTNDTFAPDTDETLSITAFTQPTNGSVQQVDGALQYSASANFSGADTFTYTISDGNGGTDTATVTLTVRTTNDPPVATNDTVSTDEDMPAAITASTLLANDNAGSGETDQTLTLISVNGATNGTVALSGNQITFTPAANFSGSATFTYTVRDNGTSNGTNDPKESTGTVTVTVNPLNDAPTAVADTATTRPSAGTITLDVLQNDKIEPDTGETLKIAEVSTPSNGGTATIVDNKIAYTPAANFSGTETFTYTITDLDTGGLTSQATVSVTVNNFVPGGITGIVDFVRGGAGVDSVVIRLAGTDLNGNEVNRTAISTQQGSYSFDNLLPGNYTIVPTALPFTVSGTGSNPMQPVSLQLTDEGLNGQTIDFTQARLHPKFAIWEALSSTSRNGLYAAVSEDDGQQWSHALPGWENVDVVDMVFSADMSSLTITIDEGTLGQMATTISVNDHSKIRMIGREGDSRLIRVMGRRSDFNFSPVTSGAEGENG
jgi:cyclophilin family peptidyl-prolyl cis-trans isomerase